VDRIKVLEGAFERGYFIGADADALDGMAGVLDVYWDARIEDGFPRLEIDVVKDDAAYMLSQAQEMGLWVEVVEECEKKVRLKFTIPPAI
jgi:hypothetical protein